MIDNFFITFFSWCQLRLVWKSAEKSNEKLVYQKLCKTPEHCFNNERSLPIFKKKCKDSCFSDKNSDRNLDWNSDIWILILKSWYWNSDWNFDWKSDIGILIGILRGITPKSSALADRKIQELFEKLIVRANILGLKVWKSSYE